MTQTTATETIKIVRELNAPREFVWKAWTDAEIMMRWWGPKNFTAPFCRIDLKVGGSYLFCMRSEEMGDVWATGVYKEIVEPERLVYTDSFGDENGNIVSAAHYGMDPDFPLETLVTVVLEDIGNGRTRMTMTHGPVPAGEMFEGMEQGWSESFDKMAASLS
jgi:uncharacterized protein YndB with AHSA1/START domain